MFATVILIKTHSLRITNAQYYTALIEDPLYLVSLNFLFLATCSATFATTIAGHRFASNLNHKIKYIISFDHCDKK